METVKEELSTTDRGGSYYTKFIDIVRPAWHVLDKTHHDGSPSISTHAV